MGMNTKDNPKEKEKKLNESKKTNPKEKKN